MEAPNPKLTSTVWKYFTRTKERFVASCNACGKELSYKTSVSNLSKHWRTQHERKQNKDCSDADSDNSDDDIKNDAMDKESNSSSTWQHFDILDSDKFLARCKTCKKDITYDSISELTEHVKEHELVSDEEKIELDLGNTTYWGEGTRRTSSLWRFFKPVDERTARCKFCRNKLSFASSISNLRQHLRRAHPEVDLRVPNTGNRKKVIISKNGQLYEIQTTDDEKDPIQTDEMFLEDTVDDNYVEHFETVKSAPRTPSPPVIKSNRPKRPKRRPLKRETRISSNKNNSSDEEVPLKKASNMNSLNLFGQYIISLLRDMPRNVSDQLQSEIIKQIMTAKTALDSPYSVTLTDKPVTVTLNNSSIKSMPEITVNDVGDIVDRNEN